MPVKIEIDKARILADLDLSDPRRMSMLASEIRADCNEYCKRDSGDLVASSLIHSRLDKGKIIWATPYAKRQYWEIRTASKDKNPMATWRWAEAAKANRLRRWERQAAKVLEMKI